MKLSGKEEQRAENTTKGSLGSLALVLEFSAAQSPLQIMSQENAEAKINSFIISC